MTSGLLHDNPNSTQPFRFDRTQAWTCDEDHDYDSEQKAFNHGLMDMFPEDTGEGQTTSTVAPFCNLVVDSKVQNTVMGYYDGNTTTAIWNYAQHFAMSDNSYGSQFGPSTVGALNLIAGNTNLGTVMNSSRGQASGSAAGELSGGGSTGTVIGDPRPAFDDCAPTGKTYVQVSGTGTGPGHDNIGDLLSAKNLTWGWFGGGFAPSNGTALPATCATTSVGVAGGVTTAQQDYVSHHTPFLYFATVGGKPSNVHHLRPTGVIGKYDQANHSYDLNDFWTALSKDELPAVSFLKFKAINDGHPGNSDPLDEQNYLTYTINKLENSDEWGETAVVILYDDSDGWYDHQMDPVIRQSMSSGDDFLTDPGNCGVYPPPNPGTTPPNGRCGLGPRQPLLVVSPWAKENYVDHRITEQASVTRFIEDNWGLDRIGPFSADQTAGTLNGMFDFDDKDNGKNPRKLFLDQSKGTVVSESAGHDSDHHDHHDW